MGVVMGLLVVSFAVWGIGDIFRGASISSVAKVGNVEISIEQFRQAFNERLTQLSRQVRRPVTSEQARVSGLDQQLLGQLLAEATLDERVRQLRLGMSDAEVARRITEEPAFQGLSGQFDRQRFEQVIRQAGYNEQRFVAEQRRVMLRRQVVTSVIGDIPVPKTSVDAIHRFQDEQRSIEYVALGRDQAGPVWPPAPEVLAKYFDEHKLSFRAPEYRKVVVLSLTPDDMARTIEISPNDVKRAFEAQKARFSTPERRQVEQIVFQKPEDAAKAAERLAGGLSFSALAAERGLSAKDTDLGLMAKSDFADPTVADAAFSLQDGATSAPVNGRFGVAIVRVSKIEPGVTKPFTEVEGDLKHDLALAQAKDELTKLRDKVEDELASGLRVEEVAKKLNLQARVIDAVDRSGRGPDGNPIGNLPQGIDVVASAFASDVGIENDSLQMPGGGFAWFDVLAIMPSRDRGLDEVKDRVEARWRDDEVVARLNAKTTEILDKLKGGAALKDVAAADTLELKTATGLKRQGGSNALSPKTTAEVFRTVKGGAGSAEGKDPIERVIFRVTDIVVPAFDAASAEAKQIGETVRGSLGDNILGEYIGRLQTDLGLSINQAGLNQALGVAPSN
jgi:peptidyl-prolyl cis-trans isomerase D